MRMNRPVLPRHLLQRSLARLRILPAPMVNQASKNPETLVREQFSDQEGQNELRACKNFSFRTPTELTIGQGRE